MQLFRTSTVTHTTTCWRHWDEWRECRNAFFPFKPWQTETDEDAATDTGTDTGTDSHSSPPTTFATLTQADRDSIRHALNIVNAWRARGRIPLAVDATAQIYQLNLDNNYPPIGGQLPAVLHAHACAHPSSSSSPSSSHSLSLRLQYSICLLRLVNGILDPLQSKQHALSINSLATKLNLPRILVDLRHDSTHQSLPSLPLLQFASLSALSWLHQHYWQAQSHALTRTERTLRKHIRAFKQEINKAKQKEKGKDKDKDQGSKGKTSKNDADDGIMMLDAPPPASASSSSSSSSAVPSKGGSILPDTAIDALREIFTTLSSGCNAQQMEENVETQLIPLLLSDVALIKTPKQSRVSLSVVFRHQLSIWDGALAFFAHKWRHHFCFLAMLVRHMIRRMILNEPDSKTSDMKAKKNDDDDENDDFLQHQHYHVRLSNQSSAVALSVEQRWKMDLTREWALHLLKTHGDALFADMNHNLIGGTSSSSQHTNMDAASRKRRHALMEDSSTISPSPVLHQSAVDEVMYHCLTHLNSWLAPLLPHLFPLFKSRYASSRPAVVEQLEQLLHVTLRAFYPQYVIESKSEGEMRAHGTSGDATTMSDLITTSATTPIQSHSPLTLTAVNQFIRQHKTERRQQQRQRQRQRASWSPSEDAGADDDSDAAAYQLVADFPFLPLGVSPSTQHSLVVDDEWIFPHSTQSTVNANASVPIPASATATATVSATSVPLIQVSSSVQLHAGEQHEMPNYHNDNEPAADEKSRAISHQTTQHGDDRDVTGSRSKKRRTMEPKPYEDDQPHTPGHASCSNSMLEPLRQAIVWI